MECRIRSLRMIGGGHETISNSLVGGWFCARPRTRPAGTVRPRVPEGFINSYLEALVAHDAKRLQVTPDVRFTEDDIELKLGEGLWKTASGLGTYQLYFADPAQGQVAFYGTIRENTRPTSIVLRL